MLFSLLRILALKDIVNIRYSAAGRISKLLSDHATTYWRGFHSDYILQLPGSVLFSAMPKGTNEETSGDFYWKMWTYQKQLLERNRSITQRHDIRLRNDGKAREIRVQTSMRDRSNQQAFEEGSNLLSNCKLRGIVEGTELT